MGNLNPFLDRLNLLVKTADIYFHGLAACVDLVLFRIAGAIGTIHAHESDVIAPAWMKHLVSANSGGIVNVHFAMFDPVRGVNINIPVGTV